MVEKILEQIRKTSTAWLVEQGIANPTVHLERASKADFGEYACNIALRYAKDLKRRPLQIAEEIAIVLDQAQIEGVDKFVVVAPGFINVHFSLKALSDNAVSIIKAGDQFGQNQHCQGKKWVIEHTSPNPNKAMHLGHMRNNLVGMGIVRLLERSGAEVVADAIDNNRGIAIAKLMYGYLAHQKKGKQPTDISYWSEHKAEWLTPEEKNIKPDLFVTECYVAAEADIKDDAVEKSVRQMVIDWEAGDEATWELWQHVLNYAYQGIERTLNRLGSRWDRVWHEHEHYQKGKDYVEKGLETGVFQKLEDGAVLTELEEQYGIPDTVVLKQDGTSLYITQDIALTDLKKKTYGAENLVWVVGPEQSLAFRQLFAVCEQLGIGELDDFTHVTYGYVGLKDEDGSFKKMSSRAGTVVLIDDVIDEVKATVLKRFKEDGRHEGDEAEELAEKLAIAAVKFSFLRSDRTQDLSFDVKQSVDVHGDSGMYVMYSYVRTQSIIDKYSGEIDVITTFEEVGEATPVLRTLLYYPDVLEKSLADLSVHHIAQYLLELCGEFNSWYAKETILDGSDQEKNRMVIVSAVATTIKNALDVLGIETVSKI
tara:strand:+ start:1250 stop:3034 length:1785 start_codon:yes stop_codon:yes gene_type:complete